MDIRLTSVNKVTCRPTVFRRSVVHRKLRVNWPFTSWEVQNEFSRWQPSWNSVSDQNNLAIFDLQVTPIFLIKFQVNWPIHSGEVKNWFSRQPPWWPSWISDQNQIYFLLSFESIALSVQQKKFKMNFQDGHRSYIGFQIRMILVNFDLESLRYFLSSFKTFGISFQKMFKIDFQDGRHDFWSEQL